MLELYQFGNSVCAQKVRITMVEKGLDWETHEINLFASEQYSPEYLKINPKGVVPTLVADGQSIIESTLICEYLDETYPNPSLMPRDSYGRSQMRLWSKAVDEGLFEGIVELSFSAMFRQRMQGMTDEQRSVRFSNVGDPRRRDRFMSTYHDGVSSPYVYHGIAAYEKAFKTMESDLSDGRSWLMGEQFTLADINLIPLIARLYYLDLLDIWTFKRPLVGEWWERSRKRRSFMQGLKEHFKPGEVSEMKKFGLDIKDQVAACHKDYLDQFTKS